MQIDIAFISMEYILRYRLYVSKSSTMIVVSITGNRIAQEIISNANPGFAVVEAADFNFT